MTPVSEKFVLFAVRWTSSNCRQNAKSWPRSKKCRHHKVVRTEILCRMHRSRNSQLSRWPFPWKIINLTQIQKKCRHHKVVRTEILCRMHRSRAPQLSRRPFSWKISNLTPIQFSNPNLLLGTSYFMFAPTLSEWPVCITYLLVVPLDTECQ